MLALVHTQPYIDSIFEATKDEEVQLDPGHGQAKPHLRLRSGCRGACLGVDMVLGGEAETAFSAMRPPGHHAEPDKAMGFVCSRTRQSRQNMRGTDTGWNVLRYLILMYITEMVRKPLLG